MSYDDINNMQIIVNGSEIDFTLEKENTLSDIIEQLKKWAGTEGYHVLDYRADLSSEGEAVPETPAADIDLLEVSIGSTDDLIAVNLADYNDYLDKAGTFIAGKVQEGRDLTPAERTELNEAIAYLTEAVLALSEKLGSNDRLEQAVSGLNADDEPGEILQKLSVLRQQGVTWVKAVDLARMNEEDLNSARETFIQETPVIIEKLEEIATLFTQGKEAEGYQRLTEMVEVISRGITVLQQIDSDNEDVNTMIDLLHELTSALDSSDMVTAADIIDYDLRDTLEKIAAA